MPSGVELLPRQLYWAFFEAIPLYSLYFSPETFVTKQLPDIDHSEMPSVLMNEEYGELMHCIDKLLNGKMIYDNNEYSLSANGASYRKDILGVIPTEINKVFQERKIYKGIMFKHKHNVTAIKNELKKRGEL